jgi:putative ABC transport system permease protein
VWAAKATFAPSFLTVALAVGLYGGIGSVWQTMDRGSDSYFTESNLADCWANGTGLDRADLAAVRAVPEVAEADLQSVTPASVRFGADLVDLRLVAPSSQQISAFHLVEGTPFDQQEGGVWVDAALAEARGVGLGDRLDIDVAGNQVQLEVAGIVMDPELIGYTGPPTVAPTDHAAYGFVAIHPAQLEEIIASVPYTQIRIKVAEGSSCADVKPAVDAALGGRVLSFLDRESNTDINYFTSKIAQVRSMSIVFSGAFVALALLTVYSALRRLVAADAVLIGTLGAFGFSRSRLAAKYLASGSVVALAGSLVGISLTYPVNQVLLVSQQRFHSMPAWDRAWGWDLLLVVGAVWGVALGAVTLAAWKYVAMLPADAMRGSRQYVGSRGVGSRIQAKRPSGTGMTWAFRDIARNRMRFALNVIGVFGSVVLLVAAVGMRESVQHSNSAVFGEQYTYDTKIALAPGVDPAAVSQLDNNKGQWLMEQQADMRVGERTETTNLTVAGDGDFVRLAAADGAHDLPQAGVAVAARLAQRMGLAEGDWIELRMPGDDRATKHRVADVVGVSFPQGVYCTEDYWMSGGSDFVPSAYLSGDSLSEDRLPEGATATSLDDQLASGQAIMKSVTSTMMVMILAAVLLSAVISYSLGVLKSVERRREYGTLRALGFGDRQMWRLLLADSLPALALGGGLGLFAGLGFLSFFVAAVSTNVRSYIPHIGVGSLAAVVALMTVTGLIVDLALLRKVMRLDLPEAVKGLE